LVAQETKHTHHWSYDGERGPEHWAQLTPDYAACGSGHQQSPINITGAEEGSLESIHFEYKPSLLRIVDNGHTVQVNYAPGSFISVFGKKYNLVQLHFHHPSEEQVNGESFELVAHLVHEDSEHHKAVVAVLFHTANSNPLVKTLFTSIPNEKGKERVTSKMINAVDLLPSSRAYFTFSGSLTTPPCTEGVTWFVLRTPMTLSRAELALFSERYPHNARPIQALNSRRILQGP
jgi:carbonic anhydrase